jgi:peptide/nickel transport system permease protein
MYEMALIVRLTRAEVSEVLEEDYIRTAWAKGLPSCIVIFKHALRNSLIPVVTMIGLGLGELIAFATITETIFQWPGMCRLFLSSIYGNDYPVIVAYIVLMAFVILFINLTVDVFYTVLNPKIQYD